MREHIEQHLFSSDIRAAQEGAVIAAGLIERYRCGSSMLASDVLGDFTPTDNDFLQAKHALLDACKLHIDSPAASTIAWALGRACDKSLGPWFRETLRHGVEQNNDDLIYQTLVALADIGEFRFPAGSSSAFDYAVNRNLAVDYLGSGPDEAS